MSKTQKGHMLAKIMKHNKNVNKQKQIFKIRRT